MKKIISVFLAILMIMGFTAVIFSAGAAGETYDVTITLPAGKVYGSDLWLVDQNGDEYQGTAMADNVFVIEDIAEGTRFIFNIGLHEKYDSRYTKPFVNDELPQYFEELSAYAMYIDQNFNITVPEYNGENFRLKAFYVSNPYDEGYVVRPPVGIDYHSNYVVYWGGKYTFRVILADGYRGSYNYENPLESRMAVTVVTSSGLVLEPGAENFKLINTIKTKKYDSKGAYDDGDGKGAYNYVVEELHYELTDITEDMTVRVSGVMADQTVNIFTWIFKILSLIFGLFTGQSLDIDFSNIFNGFDLGFFSEL